MNFKFSTKKRHIESSAHSQNERNGVSDTEELNKIKIKNLSEYEINLKKKRYQLLICCYCFLCIMRFFESYWILNLCYLVKQKAAVSLYNFLCWGFCKYFLVIVLWHHRYFDDQSPVVSGCCCYCCTRYVRAYIHHLLVTKEMLAQVLLMT